MTMILEGSNADSRVGHRSAHGADAERKRSFTYTPVGDYNGPDSFTYKANDGSLDSNLATVFVTVIRSTMRRGCEDAYDVNEDTALKSPHRRVSNDTEPRATR